MNSIIKPIKARRPVKCNVDFVAGTNMIPVDFAYEDFTIPEGSTATAAMVSGGESEEFECEVTGNTVRMMPVFSSAGTYICQVKLKDRRERTLHSFPVSFNVYPFYGE